MLVDNAKTPSSALVEVNSKKRRKGRSIAPQKADKELVQIFWAAPIEAFFGQETIAPVTNKKVKTLECERYRGLSIPYRKIGGRVLYQKRDVIDWLEGHELVTSTSEYKKEVKHG